MKKCFADYISIKEIYWIPHPEIKVKKKVITRLSFSKLSVLSGNPNWFCRVIVGTKIISEAYGVNKFEAYRKAHSRVSKVYSL